MRSILLVAGLSLLSLAAQASIISISSGDTVIGNHGTNLITNGSFEADYGTAANNSYWATGTALNPTMSLTGWTASGQANSYASWGFDNVGQKNGSDIIPDGVNALYFGASIMMPLNSMPIFASDGQVSFSTNPGITPKPGFGPVVLTQTISGLNTNSTYTLDFWASGEDAFTNSFLGGDGFFGLDISGESQILLAAPSGLSNLLKSQRYYVQFQPTASTVSISWTNWGHYINQSGGLSTELVLDDVILNADVVPEPCSVIALSSALLALTRKKRTRDKSN